LHSQFSEIPGIGVKNLEKIQQHYPSVMLFKKATLEEQNKNLGKSLAEKLRKYLA